MHLQRAVGHRVEPVLGSLRKIVGGDEVVHLIVTGDPVPQAVQPGGHGQDQERHRKHIFQICRKQPADIHIEIAPGRGGVLGAHGRLVGHRNGLQIYGWFETGFVNCILYPIPIRASEEIWNWEASKFRVDFVCNPNNAALAEMKDGRVGRRLLEAVSRPSGMSRYGCRRPGSHSEHQDVIPILRALRG